MFVDERAIIVQLRWVLWSQRPRSRNTRYLQISRWQFGADSSIILQFIALRVKARGDAVSIKDGLRTADYGLRTGYKIWTRYKTRTGKYGLGIKHGQGIKRGLRTRFKIRTADYFGTETVLIGSR